MASSTQPRAHELRHSAQIERVQQAIDDETGDVAEVWEPVLTARCHLTSVTGREYFERDAVHAEMTHRITMRYPRGYSLTPKDRAVIRSRVFEFISLANLDERDEWLVIRAKEAF